ncbi:hypothetical protein [Chitinophaga rhizophila]|uniref:YD repeat-containing protein n=1 Tax=Chitinophaga rhizophila TaxID=2866212 RepID=A0ABS7GIL3_9BACT|nr:hypothetical protein [Chitinophaga rhizophila]MBW8687536.1 hypothetical protein [Chitinophaga rhizophila]
MKRLLLSATALGMFFIACKDDENATQPQLVMKLMEHIITETDSVAITYNGHHRISLYESRAKDGSTTYYAQPVYNNGIQTELLVGVNSASSLQKVVSLAYDNTNRLLKINSYSQTSGMIVRHDSIAYDAVGRPEALYLAAPNAQGTLALFNRVALTWDGKGNLLRQTAITIVNGKEIADTVTTNYTYDDRVNYLSRQLELFLINPADASGFSSNNVLTRTITHGKDSVTETNVYTYDEDRYPVTKKSTIKTVTGGIVTTETKSTRFRYTKR